jgi:ABC-type dipeptide/oligopeptide/nickel transport system permease component/ABC-type transport system substrate-binding protein
MSPGAENRGRGRAGRRARSRFLATLLATLAAGAALGAPPPTSEAPGTLTIGLALEPPHLDPTTTSAEATEDIVYSNVFEGLTRIARDGRVIAGLAETWTVSADGLRYRFALRHGVRFHDGALLTAFDARDSLDRARAPDSANPLHGLLAPLRAVTVVDPFTLELELERPVAELLTYLAWGNLVILSPASRARAATAPVGTGPFRFREWRKGASIVLERNPDYWGTKARLARVTFRVIPDSSTALAALTAGDVDAFANFPAPENLAALSRDPRFEVVVGSTEGKTLLAINNTRAPFTDVRVRRALASAIDRAAIIAGAMYGYGRPIGSHFATHQAGYVDLTGRYPHDPAAARALLAAAGYPRGFEVTIKLPPPYYARRSGEIIAHQLAAIGVRAHLENIEWAQWLEQVFKNRDFELTIVSHTEPLDYDIYARPNYYFGYSNPAYAKLLESLSRALTPGERAERLGDVQRLLAEDSVNAFLFELPKLGVWRREVHGLWRDEPVQSLDVTAAWIEGPAAAAATSGSGHGAPAVIAALGVALLVLAALAIRRHVSARYLALRLGSLVLTLILASAAIFVLLEVLPGDPAAYMMGLNATPAAVARLRAELGLDGSALAQYGAWLGGLLHGDLGTSYTYHVPVAALVGERLAVSAPLALLALALAVLIAVPLGLAAAARPGTRTEGTLMGLAQVGLALPNFWLGILLIMVFAVGLHWFPAGGFPGWQAGAGAALAALVLPAVALAIPQGGILARVLHGALAEAQGEDYVRTARAKGLSRRQALWRHALPNALVPVLTILGMQFSFLLAGAILVETVFALPGVGRLIFEATAQRDLIVVRSVVLLLVVAVVLVNFTVDLVAAILDPRPRQGVPG